VTTLLGHNPCHTTACVPATLCVTHSVTHARPGVNHCHIAMHCTQLSCQILCWLHKCIHAAQATSECKGLTCCACVGHHQTSMSLVILCFSLVIKLVPRQTYGIADAALSLVEPQAPCRCASNMGDMCQEQHKHPYTVSHYFRLKHNLG
jgi:hypothetical protein